MYRDIRNSPALKLGGEDAVMTKRQAANKAPRNSFDRAFRLNSVTKCIG